MNFDLNFITTLLIPIVAIAISILIYFIQKARKQIGYEVLSSQSHPTYDKPLSELKFPNKAIVIEYTNTGNIALEKGDFHKPINTYFEDAEIVEAKKHFPSQNDVIDFDVKFKGSDAWFTPDLMNPKESIILYFFVKEFHNKISVSTRMKDGRSVTNKAMVDNRNQKIFLLIVFYIAALISNITRTGKILFIDSLATILPLGGVYIWLVIRDYSKIKKRQCI